MELTYRGVQYAYNPPAVRAAGEGTMGRYRGAVCRFQQVRLESPVLESTLDLKYRGVAYRSGGQAVTAAPAVTAQPATQPVAVQPATQSPVAVGAEQAAKPAAFSAEQKARLLMMGHHRAIKQREQSMLGRLAQEVGLGPDAAHYWNHIQGKVHPSFRVTYDRSHVALS